jgi:hypothetical protein
MRLKRQLPHLAGIELRRNIPITSGGTINNDLFLELYDEIMSSMVNIMRAYLESNNELFKQNMTRNFYQTLQIRLNNPKFRNDELTLKYRHFVADTLDMLQQSLNNLIFCDNKDVVLEHYKNKAAILDDEEKLLEYLNNKKRRMTIFPDKSVTVPMATLKPHYAEYIKRHGVPPNLQFDRELMREIIIELAQLGVLKLSDFNM